MINFIRQILSHPRKIHILKRIEKLIILVMNIKMQGINMIKSMNNLKDNRERISIIIITNLI
jgi:two-component SAPR family response regulator